MSSSSRYYAEFYLHHFNTYHLALQNGPFGVAKRSISQRKTACFRTRNGMYWKLLDNQCVINVLGFNRYYDFILHYLAACQLPSNACKENKKSPASDITSNAGATLTLMNVLQSTSISINEGSDSAPTTSLLEAERRAR